MDEATAIFAVMWDLVERVWLVPALIMAGYSVLALVNALKRGANV